MSQDSPEITFIMGEVVGDVYIDTKAIDVKGKYKPFNSGVAQLTAGRGFKIVGQNAKQNDHFTLKFMKEELGGSKGSKPSWHIHHVSSDEELLQSVPEPSRAILFQEM